MTERKWFHVPRICLYLLLFFIIVHDWCWNSSDISRPLWVSSYSESLSIIEKSSWMNTMEEQKAVHIMFCILQPPPPISQQTNFSFTKYEDAYFKGTRDYSTNIAYSWRVIQRDTRNLPSSLCSSLHVYTHTEGTMKQA